MMKRTLLIIAAAALAACDSSTEPDLEPTQWQAALEGVDEYAAVEGDLNLATEGTTFEAEVELTGMPDGEFAWEVAAGTCAAPGARIGTANAYPQIEPENGAASAIAEVGAVLSPTASYHASVFTLDDEEERVVVACGDLERIDD